MSACIFKKKQNKTLRREHLAQDNANASLRRQSYRESTASSRLSGHIEPYKLEENVFYTSVFAKNKFVHLFLCPLKCSSKGSE